MPITNLSVFRRPVHFLQAAIAVLALALLVPAAASAWTREAAPEPLATGLQPSPTWLTMLPDGSAVYLGRGLNVGSSYTSQLVRRPASGPTAFAAPFAGGLGQYVTASALELTSPDAAGNLLVVRPPSPVSAAFLPLGGDPAAVTVEPTPNQITAVDLAPSGEAAAIVSKGSNAGVSFRPAGPAGRFDAPRWFVTVPNQRSYAVGITLDPDGGIFAIYETQQPAGLFQVYAPPGGDFGAPQLIDVDQVTLNFGDFRYVQSSNGNGLFVWDEDISGNSNAEEIWALTRSPGGLLGGKSLVAKSPNDKLMVASTSAGITDDGSQYVGYIHGNPVSGCPTNIDGDAGGALASRTAGGSFTSELLPSTWPNRGDVGSIATEGNAVAVAITNHVDSGNRCEESDPSTSVSVRTGTGASLGPAALLASENITSGGKTSTIVRPYGLDINAGGAAIALLDEPSGVGSSSRFIHYLSGVPVPTLPIGKKLAVPGKIKLGSKLVARDGRIAFLSACTRLPGEGNKVFCRVGADLVAERAKGNLSASASAKKGGKGKKGGVKLQVLARAKQVKVPVGKSRKVVLTLNKLGKKRLAAAKQGGLRVKLRVTIRKGSQVQKITRSVKLVQAKTKKQGKGGGKAKGKG